MNTTKLVKTLEKIMGRKARVVRMPFRDCQDVPNFLRDLDAVQKRTVKSKLVIK